MKCPKCNAEITEGTLFCTSCGTRLTSTENTAEHEANSADNTRGENVFFNNVPSEAPKKKKGSGKKIKIAVIAAAVVCVGGAAAFAALNPAILDRFRKPENHLKKAEEITAKADDANIIIPGVGGGTGDLIEAIFDSLSNPKDSGSFSIDATVSDELFEMAGVGDEVDEYLGDVRTAGISGDAKITDGLVGIRMNGTLSGTDIAGIEAIVDTNEGEMYLGSPGLLDGYVKGSLDSEMDTADMNILFEATQGLAEAMPSGAEAKAIFSNIVNAGTERLTDVERKSDKIEIGDVTQKCTVFESNIDEDMATDIAEGMLEEAKNDPQLKSAVKNFVEKMGDIPGADADEMQDILDQIDNGAMEEGIDAIIEDLDFSGVSLDYYVYINNKNEVIGRAIEADGVTLSVLTASSGKKFNFEYALSGGGQDAKITGIGENRKGAFTGTVTVSAMNNDIIEIDLNDYKYDSKSLMASGSGSIRISDTAAGLIESSGMDDETLDFVKDASLNFDINNSADKIDYSLSLAKGGKDLIKLDLQSKTSTDYDPSIPDSSDVIADMDEDYIDEEEFMEHINIDELVNRLRNAGLPSALCDELEEMTEYY